MGAERIISITSGVSAELVALQHMAEQSGAKFHAVTGINGLLALLTKGDDLIAFADGLLIRPDLAETALPSGMAVMVQPAELGCAAGFERIDGATASAGIMRIPVEIFGASEAFPEDCDVFSTLQRLALQAGMRAMPIPENAYAPGAWSLIGNEAQAHAVEDGWIGHDRAYSLPQTLSQPMTPSQSKTPGKFIARLVFRACAPAMMHAGSGGLLAFWVAAALALLALGSSWFGVAALAYGFWALGWIVGLSGQSLMQFERWVSYSATGKATQFQLLGWVFDAVLVPIIAFTLPQTVTYGLCHRLFAAATLVGLVRLVPACLTARVTPWLQDRLLLIAGLLLFSLFGILGYAVPVLTLLLLLAGLIATAKHQPSISQASAKHQH